jgi:hypothetical protein
MMRWACKIFALVIVLVILWQWLDAPEHVAAHKANVERHRIERDKGEESEFFLQRKRRAAAKEFLI